MSNQPEHKDVGEYKCKLPPIIAAPREMNGQLHATSVLISKKKFLFYVTSGARWVPWPLWGPPSKEETSLPIPASDDGPFTGCTIPAYDRLVSE